MGGRSSHFRLLRNNAAHNGRPGVAAAHGQQHVGDGVLVLDQHAAQDRVGVVEQQTAERGCVGVEYQPQDARRMRAQRPLHRAVETFRPVGRADQQTRHADVLAGKQPAALGVERRDGALEAAAEVAG